MTMTNEELNTALYKKMFAQQEAFREELLQMPPEEILKHTYEYTVREDILLSLEYNDLPDKQARALLEAQESLWDIFHAFEKVETGYMDSIWQCVEERAEELLKQQELYHSDIYPHDAAYAIAHGELEQYRSSNKATLACKKAIEEAVSVHYHDNVLHKDAVAEVMQEFSNERIAEVLAITCRSLDQDRRISQENHEWARNVPVCRRSDGIGGDANRAFVISQVHPGLIDLFTRQFRSIQATQIEQSEKLPTVTGKLRSMVAQKTEQPKPHRASKNMER